ncbi:tipN [Asticcacaulis machinosus]|uniref:TipN n=1 Tax=Asticcacaulis machinosus TaxID=2984211 RepID=A0ABT5HN37_9CAUL|nr:tipN [Asticcacaulis machinosus]MDC7677656.1 tipN [Asticcacaulis machinosus]
MKFRNRPPLNLTVPHADEPTTHKSGTHTLAEPDDVTEAPLVGAHKEESRPDDGLEDLLIPTPPPQASPPVAAKPDKTSEKTLASRSRAPALRPLDETPARSQNLTVNSGPYWVGATFVSLLWALGLAAFALGAERELDAFVTAPLKAIILVFMGLFPAGMVFASAFLLRQAAILARESRRASDLADSMVGPAASAANSASKLVENLRHQVDQTVRAVQMAHRDLTTLSNQMKSETDRINEASMTAQGATRTITTALGGERDAIYKMTQVLDAQAQGVIDTVDRQARMVADASDLAQTQLREAEATLAARAADLASVAADAQATASAISDDLSRQTLRLETAGNGVVDQIRTVEEGLSQQRAGLVSAALSLRADQEDFAQHIEGQRNQLADALLIARQATVDLGETSSRGADVLRDLVVSAQAHLQQTLGAAENERTSYETRIHSTLANISTMAADARDELIAETRQALEALNVAAEDARRTADVAAGAAQSRVDRLNEALFEAGKKADEAFDSRFAAARRLIENSADLINEAGDRTAERLDVTFQHAKSAITDVASAMNTLYARADELPHVAQERIAEIRQSVEDGLLAMTESARRAALETEAVDQKFQERVQRNYEMLQETVRMMGMVSGAQSLASAPASAYARSQPLRPTDTDAKKSYGQPVRPPVTSQPISQPVTSQTAPQPLPRPAPEAFDPFPSRPDPRPAPRPAPTPPPVRDTAPDILSTPFEAPTPPLPVQQPPRPAPQSAARPRLRLTPLEEDVPDKPEAAPPPAPTPAAKQSDGWSWRDLLGGMNTHEARPAPRSGLRQDPAPVDDEPTAPAAPPPYSYQAAQEALANATPELPDAEEFDNLDDMLINEVSRMGIDAKAIITRSRLEEAVAAIATDDNDTARRVIVRVASDPVHRLSRRLSSDAELREQVNDFVTFYDRQINVALLTAEPEAALMEVLANDTGRAYLLFDAAISDLS